MNIVTLYENSDRNMRKSLDRYLFQLSGNNGISIWNDEQVLPGQSYDAIWRELLQNADLVLLLVSQDFWASAICYEQAMAALQLCRDTPPKKIVSVLLRPNSIEDTPFKEFQQLPAQDVCISQYKDSEQGYWDTYQGLKKIINPDYHYKKRPKIKSIQAMLTGLSALLLWCFFVLLLPHIYPQEGLRIQPRPVQASADSLYYKIFKLDNAAQDSVVLSFVMPIADTVQYGHLLPNTLLMKKGDANWWKNQTDDAGVHESQTNEKGDLFSQCVFARFNKNDAGEYYYSVKFSKPLPEGARSHYDRQLQCGHAPCELSASKCENVSYFSFLHHFYLPNARLYTSLLAFLLITLLIYCIFTIQKLSSYAVK